MASIARLKGPLWRRAGSEKHTLSRFDPVSVPAESGSEKLEKQAVWAFLALGVLARCTRFFLRFPLWEDECFLSINFVNRGYLDLLAPLDYHQVAPILFLWVELSLVKLFGFSEFALRVFPFLSSVGGLLLFGHLAQRLLRGPALVLAVAVLAVAYPGIRFGAEAKQYASDLFVSLVLLTLAVRWGQRPGASKWLWLLACFTPVAVGLSYTACFTAGGVSLFVLYTLWRGRHRGWRPWAVFNLVLAASFAAIVLVGAKGQSTAELDWMRNYWSAAFPPIGEPLRLLGWLVVTHTSDLFAYPVGGGRGGSALTFLCCLVGVVALYRSQRCWLLLLLAPFGVHFVAAAMHRYPYGGHVKFSQHLAPLICLLMGLGIAALIGRFARRRDSAAGTLRIVLAVLASIGVGSIARDVLHPCKTQSDLRARAFAQWFWFNASHEGTAVCLKSDWNKDFSPETYQELSWSAMYLCNRHIYGPPVNRNRRATISNDETLRCVLYRDPKFEFDEEALDSWLRTMQASYELTGRNQYPFPRYNKRETRLVKMDHVEIFSFRPKPADPEKQVADLDSGNELLR